jgi:hypothetical protein
MKNNTNTRTALEIETERATHYRTEWQNAVRERNAAFAALKVILLTPETRNALRDVDPMAFVQAARAVPISSFLGDIDATAAAIREVARVVGIIENNPPSRRVF